MIKKRNDFPEKPGVYLFKSKKNKILYIGKAKNLKKRVAHYFKKKNDLIIKNLLDKSKEIDFIVTDDEKDALHLEYNLIHSYKPPFNIRLRDDKSYPLIEIKLKDEFPGIYYSRKVDEKNFYIGPIPDSKKTKFIIDIVTRIFKLRTCTDKIFKRSCVCLYYHIGRCSAPCIKKIDRDKYNENVRGAVEFLKGNKTKVIKKIYKEMKQCSDELRFEEAQKKKEDIELINEFRLESYISTIIKVDYDVIAIDNKENESSIVLFSVIQGKVRKREFFSLSNLNSSREAILKDFIISFYIKNNIPAEIIVRFLPSDCEYIEEMFSRFVKKKVKIKVPYKGNKRKVLELAEKNLDLYEKKNDYSIIIESIKSKLNLNNSPFLIEGYDISHFSERDRVGAVVVFKNGKALRSMYRNYVIKNAKSGDTEAIKEVLKRRFKKIKKYPDLIVIDGGKPQLSVAKSVKKSLNISSDIISIAKREERIFLEKGGSFLFQKDSPEMFLFQNIRDEAHRRAITHHRKIREKI